MDHKSNALRAGSLLAIPPPPLGSQPLAGSSTGDLLGHNLTQWASEVQEVTSHMRWPPEVAQNCPQSDIVGVLNRLEGTHQSVILPTLFWSQPEVSVLCDPSPGSWPDDGFVGPALDDLCKHGLFH